MATRTVQTILRHPITQELLCDHPVSVRLNNPAFDSGHKLIVGSSLPVSAPVNAPIPALLSFDLEVCDDLAPASPGYYYSMLVVKGVTWYFVVPAGNSATPVWLDGIVTNTPPAGPGPTVLGGVYFSDNGDDTVTVTTSGSLSFVDNNDDTVTLVAA